MTERSSVSAPDIQELLRDAKAAISRAKKAVSLQASSGVAKNPPAKHSQPTSKATPEPSKPKRKLSAAGRKAISEATKKRWAAKRAAAKKAGTSRGEEGGGEEGGCEESHSGEGGEGTRPRSCESPGEEGSREGGEAPARKVAKKAPVKKAAVKAPAKKAVRVVQVATTPAPPTTEATTVTTPEQVAPEAPVK